MARLSIQSRDENHGVSIHLRPGQSCTLGSGAAADFCLPDPNLPALFCRLQCQVSGGYIECLKYDDTLTVNEKTKIRSRLVHGDTLKIGSITLDVTLPDSPAANPASAEFHVNFEDEEPESTVSDDPLSFDSDVESFEEEAEASANLPPFSVEEAETTDLFDNDPFPSSGLGDQEPIFRFEKSDFDEEDEEALSQNVESDSPKADTPIETSVDDPPEIVDEEPEAKTEPSRKTRSFEPPKFSFDSTDAEDIEMSESDLQQVYDDEQEVEAFPTMSVSLAEGTGDSESVSVSLDHDIDLTLLDSPFEDQGSVDSGFRITGGADAGKFVRWTGDQVDPALEQLLDSKTRINLFSCRGMQTQALPLSTIREQQFRQQDNEIYLLTELTMHQLQDQIRTQRWDDRMGHPRALRMFLEYAPSRTISSFFDVVDSALIVEDREVSLLRFNRNLH